MKTLIYCLLLFSLVFAQNFKWAGNWNVFRSFPYNNTIDVSKCCLPTSVVISQNESTHISIFVTFPTNNIICPALSGGFTFDESVVLGRFNNSATNVFANAWGFFYPNNNTIQLSFGDSGNCYFELGSNNTIVTNSSDANAKFNWEGAWKYDYYSAVKDAHCCLPVEPVVFKQDRNRRRINYGLYFPPDSGCPNKFNDSTYFINTSVDAGSFHNEIDSYGFFLPNGTILIESNQCVFLYDRYSSSAGIVMMSLGAVVIFMFSLFFN